MFHESQSLKPLGSPSSSSAFSRAQQVPPITTSPSAPRPLTFEAFAKPAARLKVGQGPPYVGPTICAGVGWASAHLQSRSPNPAGGFAGAGALLGKLEPFVVEVRVELDFFDGDPEDFGPVLGVGLDEVREDEPARFPEVRERVF